MPRVVDHEAQRAAILDACFSLVARRGVGEVSVRQIARAAGVSTGSLYHYFPDKQALFRQLFARVSQRNIEAAVEAVSAQETPAARLAALLRFVDQRERELQDTLMIALDYQRRFPDDADLNREMLEAYHAAIEALLGLPPGAGPPLMSVLIGLVGQRALSPVAVAPERLLPALMALLEPLGAPEAPEAPR